MGGQERANMNYFFVLLCAAGFRVTFFARAPMIERLQSPNCSVPTLESQLLMLHATGTPLSTSKCDNRIECCTTLAAITKQGRDKNCARRLEKIHGHKKKVSRTHFQRVNFVLVCPPVEKIFVAQRSVQHFCVLESKI
jgi:hypothetical protein